MQGFGDIAKMIKEANRYKKQMSEIEVLGEYKGVKVRINGLQELMSIKIDESLLDVAKQRDLEKYIKKAFKKAQKELEKALRKTINPSDFGF